MSKGYCQFVRNGKQRRRLAKYHDAVGQEGLSV